MSAIKKDKYHNGGLKGTRMIEKFYTGDQGRNRGGILEEMAFELDFEGYFDIYKEHRGRANKTEA